MNVKNRKCIRKLSLKSLYANRRRNLIAIFAIALTTLLFTSMFTIVLSLNASYETYQFRQVGGYAHGTFKDVSPEQAERIAAHPKVKAAGARKVIGITAEGVFAKIPAEISYMDANCNQMELCHPYYRTDARKRQRGSHGHGSVAAAWRNAGAGRRGYGFLFHYGQGSNRLYCNRYLYAGGLLGL